MDRGDQSYARFAKTLSFDDAQSKIPSFRFAIHFCTVFFHLEGEKNKLISQEMYSF